MRASAVLITLATFAASVMATEYTAPTTTGTLSPSGVPVPQPNGTTNGTHTPTPSDSDGAGVAISPAGILGLAVAGVAIVVGGGAF